MGGFFASGLNEGGEIAFMGGTRPDSKDLKSWVATCFNEFNPVVSDYVPGTHFKRMYRPLVTQAAMGPGVPVVTMNESVVALKILLSKLEELFETVEPSDENLQTNGHKIREVLLLACMEVESAWTAVLKENNYKMQPNQKYLTTKDYVKLAGPMLLDTYSMHLSSYPRLGELLPFKGWDKDKPTESLLWYAAYNKTKHDREGNLHYATLEHAIAAVGAAVAMVYAQFGFNLTPGAYDRNDQHIRSVFNTGMVGMTQYERDFYVPEVSLAGMGPMVVIPTRKWVALDYPF